MMRALSLPCWRAVVAVSIVSTSQVSAQGKVDTVLTKTSILTRSSSHSRVPETVELLPTLRSMVCAFAATGPGAPVDVGMPCPIAGVEDYIVDGVSISAEQKLKFKQNALVRIVIRNVNPFLFTYSISADDVALPEPSAGDFLSALKFGFSIPALPVPKVPDLSKVASLTDANVAPGAKMIQPQVFTPICVDLGPDKGRIDALVHLIASDDSTIRARVDSMTTAFADIGSQWDEHAEVLGNPQQPATVVSAHAALAARSLATGGRKIGGLSAEARLSLGRIAQNTTILVSILPATPAPCSDSRASVTAFLQQVAADTLTVSKALAVLPPRLAAMRKAQQILATTANDPERYYRTKLLDRHSGPTDVTIAISRTANSLLDLNSDYSEEVAPAATSTDKPVEAKVPTIAGQVVTTTTSSRTTTMTPAPSAPADTQSKAKSTDKSASAPKDAGGASADAKPAATSHPAIQSRINFGGTPRFMIGGGFFGANLGNRSYAPITRRTTPTPGRPGDTLAVVVGEPTVTKIHVSPVLTLNTRLNNDALKGMMDVYATVGAALRNVDGKDLDYTAGLSVSGWDNRILLTLGGYVGQTTVLGGGLHVGDQLPSATTSVPVQTRNVFVPTIGVSFRIIPWGALPASP